MEPVTATLESRALGYWVSERGDGQGVDEEGVRVHLRTARRVSLLRHYLSTIAVRPLLETTAEYHVLREIYDDAKEGDQVKLKVIIEIKEDESGDQ